MASRMSTPKKNDDGKQDVDVEDSEKDAGNPAPEQPISTGIRDVVIYTVGLTMLQLEARHVFKKKEAHSR